MSDLQKVDFRWPAHMMGARLDTATVGRLGGPEGLLFVNLVIRYNNNNWKSNLVVVLALVKMIVAHCDELPLQQ